MLIFIPKNTKHLGLWQEDFTLSEYKRLRSERQLYTYNKRERPERAALFLFIFVKK
mgnify:FL=1